jgi:hypothetical protein
MYNVVKCSPDALLQDLVSNAPKFIDMVIEHLSSTDLRLFTAAIRFLDHLAQASCPSLISQLQKNDVF